MPGENSDRVQPNNKPSDPFASLNEEIRADFQFYLGLPGEWKKEHRGQYAVIKNKKVHNILADYKDALAYAAQEFGDDQFLIQQVGTEDTVHYTTQALLGAG